MILHKLVCRGGGAILGHNVYFDAVCYVSELSKGICFYVFYCGRYSAEIWIIFIQWTDFRCYT